MKSNFVVNILPVDGIDDSTIKFYVSFGIGKE